MLILGNICPMMKIEKSLKDLNGKGKSQLLCFLVISDKKMGEWYKKGSSVTTI